ncbi:MAG: hypothetical protein ACYC2E_04590 [Sulfuricella sp.]
MTGLTKFQQYLQLADRLVEIADKEQLAECARLLALNVAHYETQYGELPLGVTLATVYSGKPNDQQAELVAKGMEIMVGVLGGVIQGFDEKVSH